MRLFSPCKDQPEPTMRSTKRFLGAQSRLLTFPTHTATSSAPQPPACTKLLASFLASRSRMELVRHGTAAHLGRPPSHRTPLRPP